MTSTTPSIPPGDNAVIALPIIVPGLTVSGSAAQPNPGISEETIKSPGIIGPITLHGTRPINATSTTNSPSPATKPAL